MPRRTLEELSFRKTELRKELDSIKRQIKILEERHGKLYIEYRRVRSALNYPRTGRDGGGDSLFVKVLDIRPYINRFISDNGFGGQRLLARVSGVSEKTIQRARYDWKNKSHSGDYLSLRSADRLMIAMGLQSEMLDLPIYKRTWKNKEKGETCYEMVVLDEAA